MPHEHKDELQLEIPLMDPELHESSETPPKPLPASEPKVDFEVRANVNFWL